METTQQTTQKDAAKRKAYYLANKERLNERARHYYQVNKERAMEYNRKYKLENKEKLAQYDTAVIPCECGHSYMRKHRARHLKSKRHAARSERVENNPAPLTG